MVVLVVNPPSECQLALDQFVEGELFVFAASAVFPLDQAVFGGAKVFFGSDGGWVVRVSW